MSITIHTANARATIQNFGRRVRAYRLAAGFSQPELGRRARVGRKFIGAIERGTSNPSLETMVLVADALGCNLWDLVKPEKRASCVTLLRAEDVRRVRDALAVIGSILSTRRRVR